MENMPYFKAGRPLVWIGSSKEDLSALPYAVKRSFGYQLRRVQQGKAALDAKTLTQFGTGVVELREAFDTNAYRLMYVVKLKNAIYVLHAFMKKSASGIDLSKRDAEMIAARLRRAKELDLEK
ncbi:MAG TPA: type II toxin-antitoxin system RelE/ParE family toxin [Rhizomicrobium sp.]|nr:type II toxin-antitoxin system RelE/ParE family toxin [Rhizomicrobium sp.]